jgi:hypothetical protein
MNFKTLQFEAVKLLTKIQTQCSVLFSELQDESHVVKLGSDSFGLTDGEIVTSIFLSDEKQLRMETEIQSDGGTWEYDFLEVADIGDSLTLLRALENIKTKRKLPAN